MTPITQGILLEKVKESTNNVEYKEKYSVQFALYTN
jgi:hypothetical protein